MGEQGGFWGGMKRAAQYHAYGPEAILKKAEEEKQLVQNAKIASSAMKVNPTLLQRLGMSAEQFEAQSASDKVAMFGGAVKGAMDEAELKVREEQGKRFALENREGTGRLDGLERFGNAMESYERVPETIRRPRSEVVAGELFRSRIRPEDAQRFASALESLGSDTFSPAGSRQIEGTDYYLQQVGRDSYTAVPGRGAKSQRPEKMHAPNEGWIYGEDMELFRRNLESITDPAVRDAVLETRRNYNLAAGKGESELSRILGALGGGGGGGKESKEKAPAGKVRKWDPKSKRFVTE